MDTLQPEHGGRPTAVGNWRAPMPGAFSCINKALWGRASRLRRSSTRAQAALNASHRHGVALVPGNLDQFGFVGAHCATATHLVEPLRLTDETPNKSDPVSDALRLHDARGT